MLTNRLWIRLRLIFLTSFTLALSGCVYLTIQARTPCFVNGELSLGSTCANTITGVTSQLTTEQSLDMIEARPATAETPAHPPAIYQSAYDYGVETNELDIACRLLKSECSYELKATIENRKKIVSASRGSTP